LERLALEQRAFGVGVLKAGGQADLQAFGCGTGHHGWGKQAQTVIKSRVLPWRKLNPAQGV
jgi:hypothetical protein